jgi:hypothetical protein
MVALDEVIANDLVRHQIAPRSLVLRLKPGTHPPLEQIPVLPPEALIPPQDISPGFFDGGRHPIRAASRRSQANVTTSQELSGCASASASAGAVARQWAR